MPDQREIGHTDSIGRPMTRAAVPTLLARIGERPVQDLWVLHALSDGGTCWLDDDGEHVWFAHYCADGCADGWTETVLVYGRPTGLKGNGHGWCAMQEDPLTVAPSVTCGACGFHRNYIEGRF